MRNPHRSALRLPGATELGIAIRTVFHQVLGKHCELELVVGAVLIHNDNTRLQAFSPEFWEVLRSEAREVLRPTLGEIPTGRRGLVPELFRGFAAAAGDPGTDLAEWLEHGAPMGITHAVTHQGIFPRVDEPMQASRVDAGALAQDAEGWENYRSAESDPEVCKDLLDRMVKQG